MDRETIQSHILELLCRPVSLALPPRSLFALISQEAPISTMDFELHPTVTLRPGSFNVLQAPPGRCLSRRSTAALDLQCFKILYVCGNYTAILSKLVRKNRDSGDPQGSEA